MIYRTGMLGLWGHTGYVTGPIADMPNASVVAVAEPNADMRRRFHDNSWYRDAHTYTNYRAMLDNEGLDIAAAFTIHGETAQALIDCAEAGVHIYTEKPLTMNLREHSALRRAVEKSGVTLTMMLDMRFQGVYRRVREEIQKGTIGEVTQATAQKSYKVGTRPDWVKTHETFAGIIPFIGCHALDLIRWTTGLEFVKGAAMHNNVGRPDLGDFENSASIIILAENGAAFSARLDYCRPETASTWGDDRIRVAGTEGVIEVMRGEATLITAKQNIHTLEPLPSISQFRNLVAHLEGREALELPAEDAFRINEIIIKLRDAADRGVMIDL